MNFSMGKLAHICIYLLIVCIVNVWTVTGDIDSTIRSLANRIQSMQVKKATASRPPLVINKEKGLYECEFKMNFHGNHEMYELRRDFGIFDNNMFATAWITIGILESHRFGKAPKPSGEQIKFSVEAINKYKDKNRKFLNSIMTFWPQVYNKKLDVWQSTTQNLLNFFDMTRGINRNTIEKSLKDIGQAKRAAIIKYLKGKVYSHAFMIPPDFDDTFVNLGLGTVLKEMSSDFPEAYTLWAKANTNVTSILNALKKYAYRPTSSDQRVNTIDPRTYFCIRKFLQNATANGESIALVSTWVQDTDEVRSTYYKGVDMPFNVNSVDCAVAANVVYGITNGILSGLLNETVLDDPEIQQIYRNSSNLIAFEIATNFTDRKDLALTNYPSEYEFYWFTARIYTQIQGYSKKRKLHPILEEVGGLMGVVLKGKMTDVLTENYKSDVDEMIYFDDFLGNGDFNRRNNTVARAEDRIFTTAMAVTALLTTWTVHDDQRGRLIWEKDTPLKVFEIVRQGVNWLIKNALAGKHEPWNAFCSVSVKGMVSNPVLYPANRWEIFNQTNINATGIIYGMQGVQSEQWYEREMKKLHYERPVPKEFHGYNNDDDSFFAFWSTDPYTYVISMLAMSKYKNAVIG